MLEFIKQFWTKSIRRQLMLGIALVHALLMTIFVFDLVERQKDFLNQQSTTQALGLAKTLAANSSSWVLANDLIGLEEVINSQSSFPNLRYAMVTSVNGRVLAHNNHDYIGLYVNDPVSLDMLKQSTQHITVKSSNSIDAASPIIANDTIIGWARVNIDQGKVIEGLDVITTNGIIYTLIAILVGTIFAFFMAKGMTQSLQHLVNVADSIREGARNVRSDIKRSDEIGRLSEDFNAMLETVLNSEYEAWLAKEQLAESEERFNLAMQGSNDGMWDWDINTGQVYYSPRWCEMLGYQPGEVSSDLSTWENAVHPDDLVKANDDIQAHLDGETSYYENVQRIKHKNGTYRWHLERGIAVRNENGEPYRMVGVTTDFTDR
ncbi:MAG: PAS domain-containing protein, partial [Thioalkalispiraceae bacterium]